MKPAPQTPSNEETATSLRRKLEGQTGRSLWRSLDELWDTPRFHTFLEAEFPALAPLAGEVDRRSLLKAMGASLALAGLAGCGQPDEQALPYVEPPDDTAAGGTRWYATAVTLAGYAQPVLGKTVDGRPVKLEGNPDHPATAGATDIFMQAALLGLFDPGRSQAPRHRGHPATWNGAEAALADLRRSLDARRGAGFRLLTGAVTSPTLHRQIDALLARWPSALWIVHEPLIRDPRTAATRRVFGRALDLHPRLDRANVVVSLDDDLLGPGPRQSEFARQWSRRRLGFQQGEGENRLIVAEPTPTLTGVRAEPRLIAAPDRIAVLARAIASAVGLDQAGTVELTPEEAQWVETAATALRTSRGRGLLTIGAHHPTGLQALVLLANERLGSFGATLRLTEPVRRGPQTDAATMDDLLTDMAAGRVDSLIVLDANPAYSLPAAADFPRRLSEVDVKLQAGLHYDETAALCDWHLPMQHELESWSDARSPDGTASILQPLVKPFYDVRSAHAILDLLAGGDGEGAARVRESWHLAWGERFEARWHDALVSGFVAGSAAKEVLPEATQENLEMAPTPRSGGIDAVLRPHATVLDGRFADNAWLQETPEPFTKLTWDNAILVSPLLAAERGFQNGDELRVEAASRAVTGAAWIMPGQAERTLTLTLGYGRRTDGLAGGLGYDAFQIAPANGETLLSNVLVMATGQRLKLASTQLHQAMDGFDFVRTVGQPATVVQPESPQEQPSFYPERIWDSPSWGMSIDLDLCIGCNACVVACVAENNVPMVGKELVAQGREMHWLRVDHYHEGDPADPKSYFQPVPCMHCEQAPCEPGCPVNATMHSFDGLNVQVYNRCVGTRTCATYCPYKVRRFNWFDYTGSDPPELKALRNPEVTVRDRGVMEKCTYCIQRISTARIAAKTEGRPLRDGEVVTACQQACPTQAIVFGDVVDPETAVSRRKAEPRDYSLLAEANTRPRTTYLARIERTTHGGGGEDS